MKKYITKKEKHANTIPADYFLQFFLTITVILTELMQIIYLNF